MKKKGNPQLENGYTKIANELLEGILLAELNKEELKIVLAIIRKTYGWNKKEDKISFTQFQELTNIDRRHINRGLKSLLNRDLISRSEAGSSKFGKPVYKYRINKKSWCQYGGNTGANTVSLTGANTVLTKENKEIFKERRKKLVDNFKMIK